MFEIPQGKRVRREDLHSRSRSPEPSRPDVALDALLRERFEDAYKAEGKGGHLQSDTIALQTPIEEPQEEAEAFNFRLFSTSTKKAPGVAEVHDKPQKIVIKSPSPDVGGPGFTQPRRPESYYFTDVSAPERRRQYEEVAVSGQEVLNNQDIHYRGLALPWRVLTLKPRLQPFQTTISTPSAPPPASTPTRKRSGKKRRIVVRKRLALRTAQQKAKSASKAEKERADREKRTRRNREKKVKKKVRDKAKKEQGGGKGNGEGE